MGKTFKCVEHEEEVLEVYPFTGDEGGRKFSLLMPHVSSNAGIAFDSTTAPALAFAILEAVGVPMQGKFERHRSGTSEHLSFIAQHLERYVADSEYAAAEAEAQAKLEAEARDFYDTYHSAADWPYQDWAMLEDRYKAQFLAVARRARELNKENQ